MEEKTEIKFRTHELDTSIEGLVYCSCKKYPLEPTLSMKISIEFDSLEKLYDFLKEMGNGQWGNGCEGEWEWDVILRKIKKTAAYDLSPLVGAIESRHPNKNPDKEINENSLGKGNVNPVTSATALRGSDTPETGELPLKGRMRTKEHIMNEIDFILSNETQFTSFEEKVANRKYVEECIFEYAEIEGYTKQKKEG